MKYIFLLLFFVVGIVFADYKRLRCLVCRTTIEEMTKQINKINPNRKIRTGSYRIGSSGDLEENFIPYARSNMHLSELMDTICEKMDDYARATDKNTGNLVLIRLITDSGTMNPDLHNFDIIQDSDLNKSLKFYCEAIVEEFEDDIYNKLKEPSPNPVNDVCAEATKLCDSIDKDEL